MRKLTFHRSVAAVVATALLGTVTWAIPASAAQRPAPDADAAAAACGATWTQVAAPDIPAADEVIGQSNTGSVYAEDPLFAVDAVGTNDVWGVGSHRDWSSPQFVTGGESAVTAEHDTGKGWQAASAPSLPPATDARLTYLSFDTPNDGWAGGYWLGGTFGPLVEHWDGTRWQVSPVLTPPDPGGIVVGIKAFGPKNVWLGVQPPTTSTGSGRHYGVIEHWDGTSWSYVPYPQETDAAASPQLMSIAGSGPDDLWVFAGIHAPSREVAYHWTGSSWTEVQVPLPSTAGDWYLAGSSAPARDDAWAVGSWADTATGARLPLTEHWDGRAWHAVVAPAPTGTTYTALNSVTVVSPTDAWAVGDYASGPAPIGANVVEHWNGSTWTMSGMPGFMPDLDSQLDSVSAASATDIWAVGAAYKPVSDLGGTAEGTPEIFHYACAAGH